MQPSRNISYFFPGLTPVEESAQTERVGEFIPILVETPTPQKGVIPAGAS